MRKKILYPLLMALLFSSYSLQAKNEALMVSGLTAGGLGVLGMIISGSIWAAQSKVPYCDSHSEFNQMTSVSTDYPCQRCYTSCSYYNAKGQCTSYYRSCYPSTCTSTSYYCQNSEGARTGTLSKHGDGYKGAWISFTVFGSLLATGGLLLGLGLGC